jgi:hypothetical protein
MHAAVGRMSLFITVHGGWEDRRSKIGLVYCSLSAGSRTDDRHLNKREVRFLKESQRCKKSEFLPARSLVENPQLATKTQRHEENEEKK